MLENKDKQGDNQIQWKEHEQEENHVKDGVMRLKKIYT